MTAATMFANQFFGGNKPEDEPTKSGDRDRVITGDSFLKTPTIKNISKAFVDTQKDTRPPFITAEFEEITPLSRRTKGGRNPYAPLNLSKYPALQQKLDTAMRTVSLAQNNQVAQTIPYSAINFKQVPNPNIGTGATTLQKQRTKQVINYNIEQA